MARLGGHNSEHNEDTPEMAGQNKNPEVKQTEEENWRALEDDFRTLVVPSGCQFLQT
jgi:hypothetical protein